MNMSYKQIIIFIMITLLASCNNDNRIANEIKELSHRKILFCEGYKELPCNSNFSGSSGMWSD